MSVIGGRDMNQEKARYLFGWPSSPFAVVAARPSLLLLRLIRCDRSNILCVRQSDRKAWDERSLAHLQQCVTSRDDDDDEKERRSGEAERWRTAGLTDPDDSQARPTTATTWDQVISSRGSGRFTDTG